MFNGYKKDIAAAAPKIEELQEGYPTEGSPSLGIPATQPGAAWFHMITTELLNAIKELGVTPDKNSLNQLATALLAKFATKADLESPAFTGNVTVPDPVQDHNPVTKAYLVDLLKRMSNVPTGAVLTIAGDKVPEGFLLCNGATLSRTTYADLFAVIGTLYGKGDGINATSKFGTAVFDGEDGNLIRVTVATNENDASSFDVTTYFKGSLVETQTVKKATELVNNSYITWDTSVALVAGDDVTFAGGTGSTFNLPDMRDRFAEGAGGTYSVGTAVEAGLPNITGAAYFAGAFNGDWSSNGALAGSGGNGRINTGGGYGDDNNLYIYFNASNSNAIYKDTTVQPSSLVLNYIIKY